MTVADRLERRVVTVLFADVVGFTSMSEQLDAEDVATVQQSYFASVREVIDRYGGTLEKFIGDAVMAVFGVPRARDDDAERAVRAAIALTHAVESLGGRLGLDDGGLKVRVGVNTGEVVHNVDADRETALVTGDTVNVAARLQSAAPPGAVFIGEETALAVVDAIELADAELLALKGKAQPVRARLVLAVRDERSREHAMGALSAPLIGRADALTRLEAAAAAGGRLLVVAPPGTGKSRLVREFLRDRPRVARAFIRPDALGPYEPVAQLVLDMLDRPAGEETEARLRERVAATALHPARAAVVTTELAALLASRPPATAERDALFAAWLDGIDGFMGGDRAIWLVEDVHWAGEDLLAFLDAAAARAGRFVVATARPSVLERAPDWCDGGEVLDLPPLERVSAGELVDALVGDALPADLVERIATASDGNPLFIEELLRAWISVGTLARLNGSWRLMREGEQVSLPVNVQAIYTAQLDDLRSDARLVVRRASVAGRRFAASALSPLGLTAPDEGLAALVRRALLRGPEADRLFGSAYVFRHALLRDAGYASLARAERASLHLRLAEWLPEAAGERWPEVAEVAARHFASALENAPALAQSFDGREREDIAALAAEWFEQAARVALSRAAFGSARTLARRALELTRDDAAGQRAQRFELLGDATASSADLDEGAAAYREAAALYRDAADEAGAARATVGYGKALGQQLQFEAMIELAEQELARTSAGELERAPLVLLRARGDIFMMRATDATREALALVLNVARRAGDRQLELEALQTQAALLFEQGTFDEDRWKEIEELAVELRRWDVAAAAIRSLGASCEIDRPAEALAHVDRAADLAEAHGLTESLAWCDYARAETYFARGDWDEALAAGRRALEVAEPNAYHRVAVRTWFVLVPIASARSVEELLDRARRWWYAHEAKLPPSDYGLLMGTALTTALGVPAPADVRMLLPSFDLDHTGASWNAAVELVIDRLLQEGEVDRARQALDRMAASIERTGADPLARAVHDLLEARTALAGGHTGEAGSFAQSALDQLSRLDLPWWRAKAIRTLAAAGAASPELVAEASALEARLGIVPLGQDR